MHACMHVCLSSRPPPRHGSLQALGPYPSCIIATTQSKVQVPQTTASAIQRAVGGEDGIESLVPARRLACEYALTSRCAATHVFDLHVQPPARATL